VKSFSRIALFSITAVLVLFTSAQATVFWDDDFEGANGMSVPNWAYDISPETSLQGSTEAARTGTKSIKAFYFGQGPIDNNPNGGGPVMGRSLAPNYTDHLFLRFAYRVSANFQPGSTGQTKIMRINTGEGFGPQVIFLEHYGSAYGVITTGMYACNTNDTWWVGNQGAIPGGPWQDIEMEVLLNTPGSADGLVRLWVNDTLILQQTGLAFRGPATNSPACNPGQPTPAGSNMVIQRVQMIRQSATGQTFYDRVAAGNTRIGVLGGRPPPMDTTPPASLTALQVQ